MLRNYLYNSLVNERGSDPMTMEILDVLLSKLYEINEGIYQFV